MTENEIRHWLNRAFYADKKARVLEMLKEQCRERAEGLSRTAECNDTGRNSGSQNGTEAALLRLAEMERRCSEQIAELVKVSDEISGAISQLHDDDLETVLIHRYILFHTIEETAAELHYDSRTVKRKTHKAIEKMSQNVLECPNSNVVSW